MRSAIDHDLMSLRAETMRWLVVGLFLAVVAMILMFALGRSPFPRSAGSDICPQQIADRPAAVVSP